MKSSASRMRGSAQVDELPRRPMAPTRASQPAPQTMEGYKSSFGMRWGILILSSFMMVGSYYCYDNPSALNHQLKVFLVDSCQCKCTTALPCNPGNNSITSCDQVQSKALDKADTKPKCEALSSTTDGSWSSTSPPPVDYAVWTESTRPKGQIKGVDATNYDYYFNLLYSVYSFPNIVLPFFGGFLVDKLGARVMNLVFCMCILAGQLTLAIGVSSGSIWIMLIGRVIFGFGGESLCVGQSALLQSWFKESKGLGLAFALGLNLSFSRLGSTFNNLASPAVASHFGDEKGVPYAIWFGVLVCCMSITSALITFCIDKRYENQYERNTSRNTQGVHAPLMGGKQGGEEAARPKEAGLSNVLGFGMGFWLLCVSCVCVYATVLPFNNIVQDFLISKFGLLLGSTAAKQQAKAALVMSIPYYISSVIAPFLGGAIDRMGHRVTLTTLSACILVAVHFTFSTSTTEPLVLTMYLPLIGQGVAYSIYSSSLWPSIPLTVEQHEVGMAYGVATAVQNGGLATFPLVIAAIKNATGGYVPYVEYFFVGMAGMGVVSGICLFYVNCSQLGGRLQNPAVNTDDDETEIERAARSLSLPEEREALLGVSERES